MPQFTFLPRLMPLRTAFRNANRVGADGKPEFDNPHHRASYEKPKGELVKGLAELRPSLITRELDAKEIQECLSRAVDEMAAATWPWYGPNAWPEFTRTLSKHIHAGVYAKFCRELPEEIRANLRAHMPIAERLFDRDDLDLVERKMTGLEVEDIARLEQRSVEEVRRAVERTQKLIITWTAVTVTGSLGKLERALDPESWRLLEAWLEDKTPAALAKATGLSAKEARSRIHGVLHRVLAWAHGEFPWLKEVR